MTAATGTLRLDPSIPRLRDKGCDRACELVVRDNPIELNFPTKAAVWLGAMSALGLLSRLRCSNCTSRFVPIVSPPVDIMDLLEVARALVRVKGVLCVC